MEIGKKVDIDLPHQHQRQIKTLSAYIVLYCAYVARAAPVVAPTGLVAQFVTELQSLQGVCIVLLLCHHFRLLSTHKGLALLLGNKSPQVSLQEMEV